MTKNVVTLSDRYEQLEGEIFLSSMQALVRLPVDQIRRDRAAGLVTGGYVTGYRGSPITTLDAQLWASKKLLQAHDIHFEPGLNEELAATSLRGTQQHDWFGPTRYQGVFGMWYGKGLGVDRACEALKLANFEGTSRHGGVLVVAGDDHAAKSSASAHQSEHTLIVGFIPILAPSTTDEILLYGQLGFEMSRFSGLYIGLKTVTDTLDLTSSVKLPQVNIVRPNLSGTPDLNIRRIFAPLQVESLVVNERLPAALIFARANGLNRTVIGGARKSLAIVTAGKPYLDVRQAMRDLGLDEERCNRLGISLVKFGMTWPLDGEFARTALAGHRELLVVEEKRPVIEEQLATALYGLIGDRPVITGKRDDKGKTLFPLDNVIDPGMTRRVLVERLDALGLLDDEIRRRADELTAIDNAATSPVVAIRPAFFCSGCPHNTSTVVPEGSFALGATGCHGLAVFMPERRTLPVVGMGAEGMPWLAGQHFSDAKHAFQNLGDGTYNHSGILSVRASVAAKSNVTFKVLYNDAVAMTGGQPIEGGLTVDTIIHELIAEKVTPVVLVTDDPEKFEGKLPVSVKLYHRDELDKVQRELREIPGTSAIVYEQTCANEKRRRRKRGSYPDPDLRLYINPAVCEGCGDCSTQSNCMSIQPLETEFGRKRQIDQSNCNKDYSCIKGYCPSFVSLRGAKPAKRALDTAGLQPLVAKLSEPKLADVSGTYSMLMTGIGGTGVLTVGAILGTAAHMEGKHAKVLDMTGMAQKGGGVMSHVRFSDDVEKIPSSRLGAGQTDVLIAYDLIVASGPDVTKTVRSDTRVIANEDVAPTGEFQTRADLDLGANRFLPAIEQRVKPGNIALIRANELAQKLMGDTIFTNLMMIGFAAQKGLLPVGLESVEEAVRLNGTAVNANLQALTLGRIAAEYPDELLKFAGLDGVTSVGPQTLDALIDSRILHLTNYQDSAYAERYRAFLDQVEGKLKARDVANPQPFLMAVAYQLARLMAYKDEYEIARLYSSPAFRVSLKEQFDGDFRFALNFGSPILALGRKDKKTGRPKKVELGAWTLPFFGLLAKLKGVRGTALDPFGYQAERRMERALIGEYQSLILGLADSVTERTIGIATEIAAAAAEIKGYGPIKHAGVERYRAQVAKLMGDYENPPEEEAPARVKVRA